MGDFQHAISRDEPGLLPAEDQPEDEPISGVEALVAGSIPNGLILPDRFIPMAEQTGACDRSRCGCSTRAAAVSRVAPSRRRAECGE
jgi:EAL domain-containing protein (putative c-di-GMP-specific phosphodiesterase class I)